MPDEIITRLTFDADPRMMESLRRLQEMCGLETNAETIRRALALLYCVQDEQNETGATLQFRYPDGTFRRITGL